MRSSRHAVPSTNALSLPQSNEVVRTWIRKGCCFLGLVVFSRAQSMQRSPSCNQAPLCHPKGEYEDIAAITSVSHPPSLQAHTLKELQPLQTGLIRAVIQHTQLLTCFSRWSEMPGAQYTVGSYIAASAVCFATFTAICQRYLIILHANWLK